MPIKFWLALFAFAVALIAAIIMIASKRRSNASAVIVDSGHPSVTGYRNQVDNASYIATIAMWVVVVAGSVGLLFTVWSSARMVPTKSVGVVTEFGKPKETLSNGFHVVKPWVKIHNMDASIQTDSHVLDDADKSSDCTNVRIGNQSTACVDNSVRWRILPEAGEQLYKDYKGFDRVKDSLVTRQLTSALNDVLATYDPLAALATGKEATSSKTLNDLSKQVTDKLKERVGTQIVVEDVIIPLIHFDGATQDKINAFQAEIANTRIAVQRELTAEAEARANNKLSASVSKDPNVLVSKCMDIWAQAEKDGRDGPLYCWPGGLPSGMIINNSQTAAAGPKN